MPVLQQHFMNTLPSSWITYMCEQMKDEKELGFSGGTSGKELTCQCSKHKTCGFDPWVGKISWRREWQPAWVLLLGESRGQRSLVGYSPQGCWVRHNWSDLALIKEKELCINMGVGQCSWEVSNDLHRNSSNGLCPSWAHGQSYFKVTEAWAELLKF